MTLILNRGARLAEWRELFRRNWRLRHDRTKDGDGKPWGVLHRYFARLAAAELRYLTNRPRKGGAA